MIGKEANKAEENGEFLDQGETKRWHVLAESYVLIGKEANKVGESGEEVPGSAGQIEVELNN